MRRDGKGISENKEGEGQMASKSKEPDRSSQEERTASTTGEVTTGPSMTACGHSEYKQGCTNCLTKKDALNKAQYTSDNKYVWSLGTPTGNVGNSVTMNDLNKEERNEYMRGYMNMHKDIMVERLGYSTFAFLRQGIFYGFFFPVESINCPERFLKKSTMSYSNKPLLIPGWIDYAVRVLFLMDLSQHGIFRVNSTIQHVTAVRALINDIVEGRLAEESGIKMLMTNFDTIDIAETYKQLLRSFNTTVISSKYFPAIKAIQMIMDENEKLICTKALLYSLPTLNRCILESNARLVHILAAKMKHELNNKQMNLEGMSKVMMPCLMLKSDDNIAIEDVLIFAEFIYFLLSNFTRLIYI